MRGSWAHKYDTISPEATALLHAAIVVDTLAPEELAAALGIDISDVREQLDEVSDAGWTQREPDGPVQLVDEARVWLTHDAVDYVDPAALGAAHAAVAGRYLDHHITRLSADRDTAIAWAQGHRNELLSAIRAGTKDHGDRAVKLAHAAWRVADAIPDPEWRHALAEAGESTARDQHELLELLRSSAASADASSDLLTAEHQYGRAALAAITVQDRDAAVACLTALARVLRDRDQPPRVADVLLELADLHRQRADNAGLATTLAEVGTIMLASARPDLAAAYLGQADELLQQTTSPPGLRARVAESHGRALWQLGKTILARRAFRRAESLTAADDVAFRERLQALLTLPRDSELPPEGSTT